MVSFLVLLLLCSSRHGCYRRALSYAMLLLVVVGVVAVVAAVAGVAGTVIAVVFEG